MSGIVQESGFGRSDFNKSSWHSTGKVTSIVDLYGARILLTPPRFVAGEVCEIDEFHFGYFRFW
jgi:hypothetical protein